MRETEYANVLAKVRELALSEGSTETWRMVNLAREPLGLDFTSVRALYDREVVRQEDKYKGQVRRALNALADDGTLRKLVRGSRDVRFLTPERYAQHMQQVADADASHRAKAERTEAQIYRLAAFGITAKTEFGRVALGPDQLDHLMDLAAKGLQS